MKNEDRAAVFCLYSYLWATNLPAVNTEFREIAERLPAADERETLKVEPHLIIS